MTPLTCTIFYLVVVSIADEISSYPQPRLNPQHRSLQKRQMRFWPHRSIPESSETNPLTDQFNPTDYRAMSPAGRLVTPNHRYRNDDTVRYPNQRGSAYDMSRHAVDSMFGLAAQTRIALPNNARSYVQQSPPDINFEENPSFDFSNDYNCSHSTHQQSERNGSPNSAPLVTRNGNWIPKTNEMNCSATSTFCEAIRDYPMYDIMNYLYPKLNTFSGLFGTDEEIKTDQENALAQRLAPVPSQLSTSEEEPMCEAETVVQFPKVAKNKDNKWVYVVNLNNYTQGVKVEKCRKENMECSFAGYFPLGFKTLCRQKYAYRKLVAINHDGTMISDTFAMPSCCACIVKKSGIVSRSIRFRP